MDQAEESKHPYNLRRRRDLYKKTNIPRTAAGARAKRVAQAQEIRKQQREQLVLGKRFRLRKLSLEEDDTATSDIDEGEISELAKQLQDDSREVRIRALKRLSKLLTEPSKAVQIYVARGDCVSQLTVFLTGTDAEEQLQALWCLTNIAAGAGELGRSMLDTAPYLISFLRSTNKQLQKQSAWALGNIALEGEYARELLRANGIIVPLVDLLDVSDDELIKIACFALSSMLHGKGLEVNAYISAGLIDKLKYHLERSQDSEVVSELSWVITYLSHCGDTICGILLQNGFANLMVEKMGQLLKTEESPLVLPLIRALGNISAGPDDYAAQLMAIPGFVQHVCTCMQSESRPVRKETLWLLSNLTAGADAQAEQLMQAGCLQILGRVFSQDTFDLRTEASFSLMNIARRGQSFFQQLPFDLILPGFIDFLRFQDKAMLKNGLAFVQIALDHLPDARKRLEQAGAPDALDSATLNQDDELHHAAGHILDQIFQESPTDTLEEQLVQPAINGTAILGTVGGH